jgi:hypothetical protein
MDIEGRDRVPGEPIGVRRAEEEYGALKSVNFKGEIIVLSESMSRKRRSGETNEGNNGPKRP